MPTFAETGFTISPQANTASPAALTLRAAPNGRKPPPSGCNACGTGKPWNGSSRPAASPRRRSWNEARLLRRSTASSGKIKRPCFTGSRPKPWRQNCNGSRSAGSAGTNPPSTRSGDRPRAPIRRPASRLGCPPCSRPRRRSPRRRPNQPGPWRTPSHPRPRKKAFGSGYRRSGSGRRRKTASNKGADAPPWTTC